MSLLLFEGEAGTGKTTRLLEDARKYLATNPLSEHQKVLALTKFHGSRRRMESKFSGKDGLGTSVDCLTLDGFAWNLVKRWRGLSRIMNATPLKGDFQAIVAAASDLLNKRAVGRWVSRSYPMVLVDELQDCRDGEIKLLSGLEPHVCFICAADTFQDLSGSEDNQAASWAYAVGRVILLEQVHRTSVIGLLNAAHSLRNRTEVVSDRATGFEVFPVQKAPQGGAITCWRIRSWRRFGEIAIISPTARGTSPFTVKLTEWVSFKTSTAKKTGATAGPYPIEWENSDKDACEEVIKEIGLPTDLQAQLLCKDIADTARQIGAADIRDWLRKEQYVKGRSIISCAEVIDQIGEIVRRRRTHRCGAERSRIALTVHQAKNREFESVIVLWPLRMQQDPEKQRRLLYNAVTRARRQALEIVEDPRKNRIVGTLFKGESR
ncbi:MAG: ATP-binding domain-containing protein [bacterium]|nr:ATP-binding domain-containing protein [bacterium]